MSLHKLLSRFAGPMLMEHQKLATFLMASQHASESQAKEFAAKRLPRVNGQIAVIPVHGVLAYYDDPRYGVSSMPRLGRMIDAAMAAKDIKAIVYDFDTPGGTVQGTPEFGAKIHGYRGYKPQIAYVNPEAASAGYWTASAADQIVITPSGEVGSIGVWTMHKDISGLMESMGVKVELISAGKYKVEGHPFAPLDKDAREEMQRSVDESYKEFVSTVAKHRGVSPETVRKDFGEGRMIDAKRATANGMADRIETFEGLLNGMRAEHGGHSRADRDLSEMLCAAYVEGVEIETEDFAQRDADELELARAALAMEELK